MIFPSLYRLPPKLCGKVSRFPGAPGDQGKVKVGRVRQVVFTIQLQTIQRRELWTTLVFHLPGQQYSRADLLRTIFGKAMELFFTDESSQEFSKRTNHKLFPYMR